MHRRRYKSFLSTLYLPMIISSWRSLDLSRIHDAVLNFSILFDFWAQVNCSMSLFACRLMSICFLRHKFRNYSYIYLFNIWNLKITNDKFVEMSVNIDSNSPSPNSTSLDDLHPKKCSNTPVLKPLTLFKISLLQ